MGLFRKLNLVVALALLVGCSAQNSVLTNSAETGVLGAALGAGVGAIIGNSKTDGLVGKSAAVGAAVGVGVGIVAGAVYTEVRRDVILASNASQISDNEELIKEKRAQVEALREELMVNMDTIEYDDSRAGNLYLGPTIGVYK